MCFIKKMNCIWIRKREGRVLDLVSTPGWVRYRGASPHILGGEHPYELNGSREEGYKAKHIPP